MLVYAFNFERREEGRMQGMDLLASKTDDVQLSERLERIRRVLDGEALTMAFQPIFDLRDGAVIGAEALARFTLEPARGPDTWFAEAASVGLGIELEMVAVRAALAGLDQLPPHLFLPINASPGTVGAPQFVEAISEADASRVVVEVSELAVASAENELSGALKRLRQIGVRFALDDVGRYTNPEGLGDLMALEPEFVKLDIALCRNVHLDTDRRPVSDPALLAILSRPYTAGGTDYNLANERLGFIDDIWKVRELHPPALVAAHVIYVGLVAVLYVISFTTSRWVLLIAIPFQFVQVFRESLSKGPRANQYAPTPVGLLGLCRASIQKCGHTMVTVLLSSSRLAVPAPGLRRHPMGGSASSARDRSRAVASP